MGAQIYFNPSCSKCRTAHSILEERNVDAEVVRYLDTPPTVGDLERLMRLLGIEDPRLMMRTGEPEYHELGLADASHEGLLQAIAIHPKLLERPIFVVGEAAVIARPPERVLELLPIPARAMEASTPERNPADDPTRSPKGGGRGG